MGACKSLTKEIHQKYKKYILTLMLCNDTSCTRFRYTRFLQIYKIFSKRCEMIWIRDDTHRRPPKFPILRPPMPCPFKSEILPPPRP